MARQLLLIENDPVFRMKIRDFLLANCPTWEISASVSSVAELIQVLDSSPPFDLILSGLQLSDGLTFSVLEAKKVQTPVIFFAEHTEHAIKAFDFHCIDFILKPFQEDRLIRAFGKLEAWTEWAKSGKVSENWIGKSSGIPPRNNFKKRFLVKSGSRLSFVPVEEVAYFIAEEGITFLVASGSSQRFMVNSSLNELESGLLDPEKFYRINRSVIINLDNLIEMKPYHNGRLALALNAKTEEAIVVARERVNEFKSWINQ